MTMITLTTAFCVLFSLHYETCNALNGSANNEKYEIKLKHCLCRDSNVRYALCILVEEVVKNTVGAGIRMSDILCVFWWKKDSLDTSTRIHLVD